MPGKLGFLVGVNFVLQLGKRVIWMILKSLSCLGNVRHSAWLSVGALCEVRSRVCDIHIVMQLCWLLNVDTQPRWSCCFSLDTKTWCYRANSWKDQWMLRGRRQGIKVNDGCWRHWGIIKSTLFSHGFEDSNLMKTFIRRSWSHSSWGQMAGYIDSQPECTPVKQLWPA